MALDIGAYLFELPLGHNTAMSVRPSCVGKQPTAW